MRVTFILPTVNLSGGVRVIAIYAKLLSRRGHKVVLVSPPPQTLPFRQKLKSFIRGKGWTTQLPAYSSHLDGSGLDHRVLDRWRPVSEDDVPNADAVIATWWETAEWVNALGPAKGAKVYFIQHHEVFSHLPVSRCHATYKLPMHKIVVARWLKEVMRTQYADDEVDIVPNSVDRTQFFSTLRGKQPVPTIGFLYSTVPFKGLEISLSAIRILRIKIPSLRLICFGSEYPISTLPLPIGAEFSFSPPQDQIRNLYSQCDVWITASRSEGFNLPAMEAMACRTPVIATRTGWPEEAIVNGMNGFLVDVDDVEILVARLSQTLSLNDIEWLAMSSNAFATVATCSWESSTRQFEAALENACRRARLGETPQVAARKESSV